MSDGLSELLARKYDELFAQIGSKRQWVDRVLKMAKGKHIESVFDPCAGAGHLPIAVAEDHNAKLTLNDINKVNFYFLKRRYEGGKLKDDNFEKWKSSPERDGYFTENFKKPKKDLRKYIDGLVRASDTWLKKSYLSDLLRRGFHRGDQWQTYDDSDIVTITRAKEYLNKIHEKDYGVSVDCEIKNKTIEDLEFPRSDLVIFDPPYQDQASPQSADAEVLMQEELELSFPHDRLEEIMRGLQDVSKHQLFFGGEKEKEVMEEQGMGTEEWDLNTGGMDWSKGSKDRVEYVHTTLSQELREELSKMKTVELLKLEREIKNSPRLNMFT